MSHATQPLINSILKYLQISNKWNHSMTNEVEIICNMAENRIPKNTYCWIIYRLSREERRGNLKVKRQRENMQSLSPNWTPAAIIQLRTKVFKLATLLLFPEPAFLYCPIYYFQNPPFSIDRTRIRFHGTTKWHTFKSMPESCVCMGYDCHWAICSSIT